MRVTFAHLCDYALIANDGKMSVMGIFSQITSPVLPYVHPVAFLAFEVEVNYAEMNKEFQIKIDVVDPDGRSLFRAQTNVKLQGPQKPGTRPKFPQVLGFSNMQFMRPGTHNLNIFLNDSLASQLDLEIVGRGGGGAAPPELKGKPPRRPKR